MAGKKRVPRLCGKCSPLYHFRQPQDREGKRCGDIISNGNNPEMLEAVKRAKAAGALVLGFVDDAAARWPVWWILRLPIRDASS